MANHKKYSILEFAVPLGNYDNSGGYGITSMPFQGERSTGSKFGIYDNPELDVEEDSFEEEDGLIDVSSKIDYGRSMSRVDIGRADPNGVTSRGLTRPLVEKNLDPRDDSSNPITLGISPGLSGRKTDGTKATKSSFNSATYPKFYLRPRVDMTATQYGTSRAPLPRHDEMTEDPSKPTFSLTDMLGNEEYAYQKFQNNVNKIKNIMEIINF